MGLFISGIAPCVKTHLGKRDETCQGYARLLSVPSRYRQRSAKTEGSRLSKPHNRFGYEIKSGVFRHACAVGVPASNPDRESFLTTDPGLPEPDDLFRECLTV